MFTKVTTIINNKNYAIMYYKLMGSLKIVGKHANPAFCAILNDENEVNETARIYKNVVHEMHAYKIETTTTQNSTTTTRTKIW